jgi:hypothetical protein
MLRKSIVDFPGFSARTPEPAGFGIVFRYCKYLSGMSPAGGNHPFPDKFTSSSPLHSSEPFAPYSNLQSAMSENNLLPEGISTSRTPATPSLIELIQTLITRLSANPPLLLALALALDHKSRRHSRRRALGRCIIK